jgi:hypothetical protein
MMSWAVTIQDCLIFFDPNSYKQKFRKPFMWPFKYNNSQTQPGLFKTFDMQTKIAAISEEFISMHLLTRRVTQIYFRNICQKSRNLRRLGMHGPRSFIQDHPDLEAEEAMKITLTQEVAEIGRPWKSQRSQIPKWRLLRPRRP